MARPPTPLRILIVDDDAMMRELLELLFEREGYAVQCADSGDAALALLRPPHVTPEVVIADIQMPGTTGARLAMQIRRACPSTLLLAMSGSTPAEEAIALYDAFLMKPFTMEEFAVALSSHGPSRTTEDLPPNEVGPKRMDRTGPSYLPISPSSNVLSIYASSEEPASNDPMELNAHQFEVPPAEAAIADSESFGPELNRKIYEQLAATIPAPQLRDMYAMCLNDIRDRIASMRRLAAAGDPIRFGREAHSIKGGCGMLGATELYTLAAALEKSTLDGAEIDSVENVNSLDELVAACNRLERILGSRA